MVSKGKKIKITLVKSTIGQRPNQKKTVTALGLGKLNSNVEKEVRPEIMGMVRAVAHLVKVEEMK